MGYVVKEITDVCVFIKPTDPDNKDLVTAFLGHAAIDGKGDLV